MAKLIGNKPNQVPTNADLGDLAYQDGDNAVIGPITVVNNNVGVGTTAPAATLDVAGTGAVKVPVGTDAQRPTPATGQLRFNTQANSFEGYDGTAWGSIGGTAAAWVNFNGTGTIAARDSENVSSLTDNGTGDYTVNFSNAFSNANYSGAGLGRLDGSSGTSNIFTNQKRGGTQTASAFGVASQNASPSFVDIDRFFVSVHGDLA